MDTAKVILDFVGQIAWPVVAFFAIILFRTQIAEAFAVFSQFNKASKLSFKVAGQEVSLEREIKQQILKEEVAREAAEVLDPKQAERVAEKVAAAVSPLIGADLSADELVILHVLMDADGSLSHEELRREAAAGGVRAGVGGKVTGLKFDGLVSRTDDDVQLTELGKRVAGLLSAVRS